MVDINSIPVELAGFRELDSSVIDEVRRNIDKHLGRLSKLSNKLENLHLTLKTVHEREKGEIYDIKARMRDNGKIFASHSMNRNLLAAVDDALEKLASEIE